PLHSCETHPCSSVLLCLFFLVGPAPSPTYSISLHDALPICTATRFPPGPMQDADRVACRRRPHPRPGQGKATAQDDDHLPSAGGDRKSTRLNSSHVKISYAVFCLKKKNRNNRRTRGGRRSRE